MRKSPEPDGISGQVEELCHSVVRYLPLHLSGLKDGVEDTEIQYFIFYDYERCNMNFPVRDNKVLLYCIVLKVPTLWKVSIVVPVPKKSCPASPNDFRPVALKSHIMKSHDHDPYRPFFQIPCNLHIGLGEGWRMQSLL